MVIAIIREDLITEDVLPGTPTMLTYKTHADAGSLYNTPNAYCIYVCGKVFKWLKAMGGLEEMQKRNIEKAKILYDYLDQSKLFKGTVEPNSRSLMNVPFVTGDKDMDAKFVKEAKEAGFENHGVYFTGLEPLENAPVPISIGTDASQVSHTIPLITISAATMCKGTPLHHWAAAKQAGMSIGHKGMLYAARCMAEGTKLLMKTPGAIKKIWEWHNTHE